MLNLEKKGGLNEEALLHIK